MFIVNLQILLKQIPILALDDVAKYVNECEQVGAFKTKAVKVNWINQTG